jgi:hypothetical protein
MSPCAHPVDAVMWNPYNRVTQCHHCGAITERSTPMPESTFRDMTPEHLGATATDDDLDFFRRACREAMVRQGLSEAAATDYVWNDGDWYARAAEILD